MSTKVYYLKRNSAEESRMDSGRGEMHENSAAGKRAFAFNPRTVADIVLK